MHDTLGKAAMLVSLVLLLVLAASIPAAAPEGEVTPPAYDTEGRLQLPEDYRQWVVVGTSLGLSYSEGESSHEMFHTTLMEPGAYRHFVRTGEFADGTQLVLILQGTGEGVLPGRRGRFGSDLHGVEMAVKDLDRSEVPWAYYGFGGMGGVRKTAEAFPDNSCYDCHVQHAARDNVFVQFYPLLTEAAGIEVALRHLQGEAEPAREAAPAPAEAAAAAQPEVALAGLDPVMLVQGRQEMGKPEIVQAHAGFRYQFASEPNRARFAADPQRYSMANETCPVVPGAAIEPDIFLVHEERIYTFATEGCRAEFEANPAAFLPPGERPR